MEGAPYFPVFDSSTVVHDNGSKWAFDSPMYAWWRKNYEGALTKANQDGEGTFFVESDADTVFFENLLRNSNMDVSIEPNLCLKQWDVTLTVPKKQHLVLRLRK